tara:strand:+ start:647 stop:2518 length:1872 start_codon:yes stop_codon:yes gene_type:complete
MKIEPLSPDLLIAIYAIHKFYKELDENSNWLTDKESGKKKTIAENKCDDIEYYLTSPILWDCASFFFEADQCIERIRNLPFAVGELQEIIHSSKSSDFDCTFNLTEEWEHKIQHDQEKLHKIPDLRVIIDKAEGEALKMLRERFAKAQKKAEKEPGVYPRKTIAISFPFKLAYWISHDIFRCLRFEIKKLEEENNGTPPSFDVLELLTVRQPVDLRLVKNREILRPILNNFLEEYLKDFREGSLFNSNVLKWNFQKKRLMEQLDEMSQKYGPEFFISRDTFGELKIEHGDYKPVETLLALDYEGVLNIKSFRLQEVSAMNKWEKETGLIEIEVELQKTLVTITPAGDSKHDFALTEAQKRSFQQMQENFAKLSQSIDLTAMGKAMKDNIEAVNAFTRIASPNIQSAFSAAVALRKNEMNQVAQAVQKMQNTLALHIPDFAKAAAEANKLGSLMAEQIAKTEIAYPERESFIALPSPLRSSDMVVSTSEYSDDQEELEMLRNEVDQLKQKLGKPDDTVVTFDEDNGNVIVGEKVIGEIELATREYFFFQRLYQNIGKPASHIELYDYIREQMGIKVSYSPNVFTSKIKGELKKKIDISKLIKSAKNRQGENGYCLRSRVIISDN